MTVCIAARANDSLFGVSDRMLTSGDIQFEPAATPKILSVSNSIAVMQAGDAAFNTEIMREVSTTVAEQINANPTTWHQVKDVAELYVNYRNEAKRKRAESALLAPLGLNINDYRRELQYFKDADAARLLEDLINFEVPHTEVIVAGIDMFGPHIYVVDDGRISCNDMTGFAAIGIGARHAESQFMLARHAWNSPLVDTALLAYIAKKRSEVAPGVGEATDMFTVGPGLGTLSTVAPATVEAFEQIYQRIKSKEGVALDDARKEANDFVAAAAATAAERGEGQQPSPSPEIVPPTGRATTTRRTGSKKAG